MAFKLILVLLTVPFITVSGAPGCDLLRFRGGYFRGSGIVHRGFVAAVEDINRYAIQCNVKIHLTSSFRKDNGRKITGAIVTPSKISNHFVGHAIDMNVVDGRHWCNSNCLRNEKNQRSRVKCFISKIKQDANLRWGGDFSISDPVHIDDGLNRKNLQEYHRLYKTLQTNCQL